MFNNREYLIIPTTEEIVGAEGPYTYEEILVILSDEEWSAPMEEV